MSNEFDSLTSDSTGAGAKPYRVQARVAWILILIVCILSVIPLLGFASWFLSAPMMLISFVMVVMVFSKGGVGQGLALLLCQLIVVPIFVFFGPIITSMLGLAGAVGALSTESQMAGSSYKPDRAPPSQSAATGEERQGKRPVSLPDELRNLKENFADQRPALKDLADRSLAREGAKGYLIPAEEADIDARKIIQQENLWREQAFDEIARLTGTTRDEVAASFAKLASQGRPQ